MAWVRLDCGFFRHQKAARAGKDGRALFLAALCYCGDQLTDGRVPKAAIRLLAFEAEVKPSVAKAVTDAGLWTDEGDCYVIRDFLEMGNQARSTVESERDRWRESKRRNRTRPADVPAGHDEESRRESRESPGHVPAPTAQHSTAQHKTNAESLSAAAALRCREEPAAAAAVDLILTIRETQQRAQILHPAKWRQKTRPLIAEEFLPTMTATLAEQPDADATALVMACGFSEWDIPA